MTQFAVRRTPKPDDRILTNATHPFDPNLPDAFVMVNGGLLMIKLPAAGI